MANRPLWCRTLPAAGRPAHLMNFFYRWTPHPVCVCVCVCVSCFFFRFLLFTEFYRVLPSCWYIQPAGERDLIGRRWRIPIGRRAWPTFDSPTSNRSMTSPGPVRSAFVVTEFYLVLPLWPNRESRRTEFLLRCKTPLPSFTGFL